MIMINELCYCENEWVEPDICDEHCECCDSLVWIGSFARPEELNAFKQASALPAASEYYYTLKPELEEKNGTLS